MKQLFKLNYIIYKVLKNLFNIQYSKFIIQGQTLCLQQYSCSLKFSQLLKVTFLSATVQDTSQITQNSISLVLGYNNSDNKDLIDGIVNAALPVGAAIGAATSNYLVKKLTYRLTFLFMDLIGVIAVFISFIPNLYLLIVIRFVFGLIVGINSSISVQYICQFIPQRHNGFFAAIPLILMIFALTVSFAIQWIFLEPEPETFYNPNESYGVFGFNNWRIIFGIPIIFFCLRNFSFLFVYTHYLPSEYLSKGQKDMSIAILKLQLKHEMDDSLNEENYIQNKLNQLERINEQDNFNFTDVLSEKYKKIFLVCLTLGLCQQLAGINAVNFYVSEILGKMTSDYTILNLATVLVGIFNTFAGLLSSFIITKYGRKPILIIGLGCCTFCLSYLTIALIFRNSDNLSLQLSSLIFLFLFIFTYGMSIGPLFWVYSSEVLPQKMLDIIAFLNWLGCAIIVQLFPIVSNQLGMFYNFGFYAIVCFITLIIVKKYLIESKDMTKIDILRLYQMIHPEIVEPTVHEGD